MEKRDNNLRTQFPTEKRNSLLNYKLKLTGIDKSDDKSSSSHNLYNNPNLLSSRSLRPRTNIEKVVECLNDICD